MKLRLFSCLSCRRIQLYLRTHEGVGLGLTIVKKLTELQNGTVSVESQKDIGTTFTVTLPITFS
ncbi:MAG: ATP-binding protein [Emcibacteraceae bacterium]